MTLARNVLERLVPFLRFVVASSAAGVPLPEGGEVEPLGWWLTWRANDRNLTIRTALPARLFNTDRQEVLLSVAVLPAILGASIEGTPDGPAISVTVDRLNLNDLRDWLDRWKSETEAHGW